MDFKNFYKGVCSSNYFFSIVIFYTPCYGYIKKILGGLLRMSKIDNNIDPTLHEFMDDFYKRYKDLMKELEDK